MRLVAAALCLAAASARELGCTGSSVTHLYKKDTKITASITGADGGNSLATKGGQGGFTDITFTVYAGNQVRYTTGCKGADGGKNKRAGGGGGASAIELIRHDGASKVIAVAAGGGGAAGCGAQQTGGAGGGQKGTDGKGSRGNVGGQAGGKGGKGSGGGKSATGKHGGSFNKKTSFGYGAGGAASYKRGKCGGGGGGGGYVGGGAGGFGRYGTSGGGGSGYCLFGDADVKCFTMNGDNNKEALDINGKIVTVETDATTAQPTASPTEPPTPRPTDFPLCQYTTCEITDGKTKVKTRKDWTDTRVTASSGQYSEKWHCMARKNTCECRCDKTFKCTLVHPIQQPKDGAKIRIMNIRNKHC